LSCSVENSLVSKDMMSKRQDVGARGEKLAVDHLKRRGYKIIQRNFRCREGEIDIIAQKGECLVFVEVRTKKNIAFGTPEESVTLSKREKLISLANAYLQAYDKPPLSWRIDVVAVELTPENRVSRLNHIENAVS
jgi:putative endonuclease